MANISLREGALMMERDNVYTIKIGNFNNFDEFQSYFDIHYKPLLERLACEWASADDVRRFFADDMLSAFGKKNELKN